jgi:glycosyltransferase involved in cell wall biosynthesis
LGKIPYQEVQSYIQKAHVCVFPTYAETLGMVTIESMAMQKPVVNSNIGWAQELMVDGESGFLVHPSNHDLYAKRIESLLNDPNLTLQMGEKAQQYVAATFDIEQQVLKNISFYKNVLQHAH